MSVREYAVLYLGAKGKAGAAAGGGNVVLTGGGAHALDGPEHLTAGDATRLDASTTAHGLAPKLSGDAGDAWRGDGTWGVPDEPIADAHLAIPADAHDASAISVLDPAGHFTATDVEAALAELGAQLEALQTVAGRGYWPMLALTSRP